MTSVSRAWLSVGVLWFAGAFNFLTRTMITTMHGSVVAAFPMTEAQFGLLTTSFLVAYGVTSPFAGFVADRFSRRWLIFASLFSWSAITWLTSFAQSFEQLVLMRSLMGISEAFFLPAALAMIADLHRGPTRSFAVGVLMTGNLFGASLGGLGGWLAEVRSWSFAFSAVGLAGMLYGVLLIILLRDTARERDCGTAESDPVAQVRFGTAFSSLFRRGSFVAALAYWALLGATSWVVIGWLPVYFRAHFHLSQGVAGISATAYEGAAALVGMLAGGAWADRWSRTNRRAPILVPIIALCAAVPGLFLTFTTPSLAPAVAGIMVYGLAAGCTSSTMMPILCLIVDPRYRATGYGFLNMTGTIAGGLAIYVAGALQDLNLHLGTILLGAVACVALCTVLLQTMRPIALSKTVGEPTS